MKLKFSHLAAALAGFFLASAQVSYCAPPGNPCTLLTQAQVSIALGIPVAAGKQGGPFDCEWDQPGWTLASGVRLLLHVVGPVGRLTPAQQFDTMKMPVPFNKTIVKTPASGIGDDAVYISSPGSLGTSLAVRKGDSVFQVRIQGFRGDRTSQLEAMEKKLAQNVLAGF
jgi:hypothetical protein